MEPDLNLKEILEERQGECHVIVLPSFPSPDAISSAFAHKLISSEFNIEVKILYSGRIRPRQNVALIKLLGIDITPYQDEMDLSDVDGALLVGSEDSFAPETLKALEKAKIPIFLTLDPSSSAEMVLLETGAAFRTKVVSTLYASFLQTGIVELNKARKEHVSAATSLLFGILSATDNFILANEADFKAASFLSRYRDAELLEHIMSQVRTKHVMEIIRRALGDRIAMENYSIAGIGYLRVEDREAVPQAAEFLLSEENVHTAIVYGIMPGNNQEETLVGAVRTSKITIYPEEFIEELFGRFVENCDNDDDQLTEDGFNIPIGFLAGNYSEQYRELKWKVFDAQVKQIIFEKIGVKQEVVI